jgi:DNA-binding SARP family transcriptional activator
MLLRIHVLDPMVLEGSEVITEDGLHGPQGRLVLAMLAVEHRRAVTADEIAEELWPRHLPAAWPAAVKVLVSKVRTAIARATGNDGTGRVDLIAAVQGGYRLTLPAGASVDLDEAAAAIHHAEELVGKGELDAGGGEALTATMIASRPFLPGADGPWATLTRERVGDIRIRALEALARVWLAKGDPGQAARDAEAILRLDPYRETALRLAMQAHVAAGDRPVAARAYRRSRELLAGELGIEPTPETEEMARHLGLTT